MPIYNFFVHGRLQYLPKHIFSCYFEENIVLFLPNVFFSFTKAKGRKCQLSDKYSQINEHISQQARAFQPLKQGCWDLSLFGVASYLSAPYFTIAYSPFLPSNRMQTFASQKLCTGEHKHKLLKKKGKTSKPLKILDKIWKARNI